MYPTPPFRHHATVERDEPTPGPWNNPGPPAFVVVNADLRCDFWARTEDLITGPDVNAALEQTSMLVAKGADVIVGDEISDVRDEAGETISVGRLRVVADLPMPPTHRELHLELASAPVAPAGS